MRSKSTLDVGPVFVGGTGRSGTTIIARLLGLHPEIYTFPIETRFMVDPGGLVDLIPALSELWSPWYADRRISDFKELMDNLARNETKLTKSFAGQLQKRFGMSPQRYSRFPLGEILGSSHIKERTHRLIDEVTYNRYEGFWAGTKPYVFRSRIYNARRFQTSEIHPIVRDYVDSLFAAVLTRQDKSAWLDHTPTNVLYADFLFRLYPQAKIINVFRDPRDVACSYRTVSWGGSQWGEIVPRLRNLIETGLERKQAVPDSTWFDVRFEEFISDPQIHTRRLCDFLGIDVDSSMFVIDLTRAHIGRWREELSTRDAAELNAALQDVLNQLDYTV